MHRALVASVVAVLLSTPAFAVQRTFVASTGNDSFPCSLTQPCRSFATAISATDVAGEIIVLDSAGYGPVAISKSVSITAPNGIYAGVTALSGNGVDIIGAGLKVNLRGLNINSIGGGVHGVNIADATFVRMERLSISGFSSNGIKVLSASLTRLEVEDTVLQGNALNGAGLGGLVNAMFSRVTATQNGNGLGVGDGAWAEISKSTISNNTVNGIEVACTVAPCYTFVKVDDTVITQNVGHGISATPVASGSSMSIGVDGARLSHNGGSGIYVSSAIGNFASLFVTRSNALYNQNGVVVDGGGAQGTVSDSTMQLNATYGMAATNGGAIFTRANNVIISNVTNTAGSITFVSGV